MKSIDFSLAALSIALILGLSSCSEVPVHKDIVKTVYAVSPAEADQSISRTLSGVLQAVDQSVLSFEIPGVISSINVNLGDRFSRADVLATIDDKVVELALQQRKGQLSEAKARLTEAELDFRRKQQLLSSGAVSKAEVDIAQARFASLQDQVSIAETQVAIAEEDLDDTKLLAPFDGSVAIRHVEPSQQVAANTPILTIQGSDALEVAVFVPESLISRISVGDEVEVNIVNDKRTQRIKGSVFEKGNQAQRANAFPVTITLERGDEELYLQAGMSAEVKFMMASNNLPEDAMRIPLSALGADRNNQHFVFALTSQNSEIVVVKRSVRLKELNAENAIVTSDEKIERIVLNGIDFLRDGQRVKVADDYPKTINQ